MGSDRATERGEDLTAFPCHPGRNLDKRKTMLLTKPLVSTSELASDVPRFRQPSSPPPRQAKGNPWVRSTTRGRCHPVRLARPCLTAIGFGSFFHLSGVAGSRRVNFDTCLPTCRVEYEIEAISELSRSIADQILSPPHCTYTRWSKPR